MAEKEEEKKNIKVEGQEPEATQSSEKKAEEKTEEKAEEKTNEKADAEKAEAKDAEKKEEKQEDPLEKANKEIADLKDKYLRTLAEFDNYKKRTLKEKAELILNGSEKTVKAVLPVLDDFERALKDKSEDPKAIKDGVQMIFNKFVKALESLGVKKIDTDNKDFDTDFHEAVAMVPGMGDEKKGKVIDCVQTGYTLNDKVIRHAKVAVGQ
ncbi:MAG: nucleotide exchange factor GrpE [Prevotella sp.]